MGTSTNISSLAGSNTTSDSKDVNMVYFMYGGYVVIIIVLGLVQNTMTVYVFVRDKRLRLFHNYYIVGLATADVGMCLTGNWMIAVAAFHGRWVFGRHGVYVCQCLICNKISILADNKTMRKHVS